VNTKGAGSPFAKLAVLGGGLLGALGIGAMQAGMTLPPIIIPLALAVLAGLWRFNEITILILQDYLSLVTTPISWYVTLPDIPMSLPFVAIWAIAATWRHVSGKDKLTVSWGLILHLLLAALIVLNYITFAEHTPYATTKFFLIMTLNIASFLGGATLSREQLARVFYWMMGLGLIVALLTYQAYAMGDPTMLGRYSALKMNPIWTCRLAILGAFATLVALRDKRWGLVYLVAIFPVVLLTGSRGPLVAAILSGGIMGALWWVSPRRERTIPKKANLVSLGLAAMILQALLTIAPAFAQETRSLTEGGTASSRMEFYVKALEGFSENMLLGVGLGGFEALVSYAEVGEEIRFPHNIFLEVAVELGIFGLGLFVAIILHYFWLALKNIRYARLNPEEPSAGWGIGATLGFVNLMVAAQFSGDLVTNHALWYFMGLMTRVETMRRMSEDAVFPDNGEKIRV